MGSTCASDPCKAVVTTATGDGSFALGKTIVTHATLDTVQCSVVAADLRVTVCYSPCNYIVNSFRLCHNQRWQQQVHTSTEQAELSADHLCLHCCPVCHTHRTPRMIMTHLNLAPGVVSILTQPHVTISTIPCTQPVISEAQLIVCYTSHLSRSLRHHRCVSTE